MHCIPSINKKLIIELVKGTTHGQIYAYNSDNKVVKDFFNSICKELDQFPYVKKYKATRKVQEAYCAIYQHGQCLIKSMQQHLYDDKKGWKWGKDISSHIKYHTIIKNLKDFGYQGLDVGQKFITYQMEYCVTSFKTNCCHLYKLWWDLKWWCSYSIPVAAHQQEGSLVSFYLATVCQIATEVSKGTLKERRENRHYTLWKFTSLTHEQKDELRRLCQKQGNYNRGASGRDNGKSRALEAHVSILKDKIIWGMKEDVGNDKDNS